MIKRSTITIDENLCAFIENEVMPGLPIEKEKFWNDFAHSIHVLMPKNRALLKKRETLQQQCDSFYKEHKNGAHKNDAHKNAALSPKAQEDFLKKIGYLVKEGSDFTINPENVDEEIATIAGPQLVVPIKNARFALNAANARFGSLLDALYGTDVICEDAGLEKTAEYNPKRGMAVLDYCFSLLDDIFPLSQHSHKDVTSYQIKDSKLIVKIGQETQYLKDDSQFVGYNKNQDGELNTVILKHHHLHGILEIDPSHMVGKTTQSGLKDIILEAAITTIQDFEDSVAAVDAEDKIQIYRHWLGLMKGDLEESFQKNGQTMHRTLCPDISYYTPEHTKSTLHGRSLLFMRHVGHLMTSDAILDQDGLPIGEGVMDGFVASLCSLHDIYGKGKYKNSREGSIYIVKPKMHGPEEVAFCDEIFTSVEQCLQLPQNTMKIGIMDEEKRTTLNLKECVRMVKDRVVFINTGFLDRTGSEIHHAFEAGIFCPKGQMKSAPWLAAYENWNVDIGLETGFIGKAQIGKGMWAMPDEMAKMMCEKTAHPKAGADCAWVPSPSAAILHAMHYLYHDVLSCQNTHRKRAKEKIENLLTLPLIERSELSDAMIEEEIRNNAQGILGYVVRWIDHGVGCSKVPNIDNVGLMEDRATLRISSQILANWLYHGVCSEGQLKDIFKEMTKLVDHQNHHDKYYKPMSGNEDVSLAYQVSLALVLHGQRQPSGYTEPLLHEYRLRFKSQQ